MSIYPMSGIAGMSYSSAPVQPVNKVQGVTSALQTKTVSSKPAEKSGEVEVLGNGDFAISNFSGAPANSAQAMYVDPLTNQRVWSA